MARRARRMVVLGKKFKKTGISHRCTIQTATNLNVLYFKCPLRICPHNLIACPFKCSARKIGNLAFRRVWYTVGMIEFKYTGQALYARMERAVEKVNQRLIKTVQTIENAEIPYAVIGGFAVRAWVAQVDEAAVRTTRDVDILVRQEDLPALVTAMTNAGFYHRQTTGLDMFVEHPEASARDAVHVLISGRVEKTGDPNPDVEPSTETTDFRTVPLRTLVSMKLNAFRDKDRVHLRDMISLNMIDGSWLEYYPERLRLRLQELLDDPDG